MPYLTALSISLGFLTFYSYRNKVEKEIEQEKVNEEKAEKKRAKEFDEKFSKINKIPIFRNIIKWMYKEGWSFSIPLIVITLIFICIKIGMPIIYNGSYIDEYFHIFSGIEFFKTGHFAEIYYGEYYTRGAYVSFLVGLFFKVFGKTILVAKMVPATIGLINFGLLYKISRHIIGRKKFILLLLIIYSISPWIIFNHFYIRMYVFYEFFILLLTLLFIYNWEYMKSRENIKFLFSLIVIIFIVIILLFFNKEDSVYKIFLFYSCTYLISLFVLTDHIKLSKYNRIFFLLLISVFCILYFDLITKIELFQSLQIAYSSPPDIKYNVTFFEFNQIFSIFFLISSFYFLLPLFNNKINSIEGIIISLIFLLFILHFFLPLSLQINRGILYFFSLFYLSIIMLISKFKQRFILILFIILLFSAMIISYPQEFLIAPGLPNEIAYIDNNIYLDVQKNCEDSLIITSARPWIPIIYDIKPSYYLNTKYNDLEWIQNKESTLARWDEDKKIYFDTYSGTPLITNTEEFINIQESTSKKICYITGGLPSSWVDTKTREFINLNFDKFEEDYKTNYESSRMYLFIKDRF
jgi:hypothetical protein